ncbi:MAG: acetyl-CoA carboxylase biotin carboxylase subunit [Bacteroidales bacterium]|nr:acetyl-CoA carboxylase biotin carboxylase subunit [Bacteroidales bacterium]
MTTHRIKKVLIANRGEIAMRIMRSLRKMNIEAVAIYAEADKYSLHAVSADEAWSLGSGELSDTYLNVQKIVSIARQAKADAIHPGYGFLSENPVLVEACNQHNIIFIGPDVRSMELMGNKISAREYAVKSGLPVTKGLTGTTAEILESAGEMPFPVLVKAAAGGGGKGMRIVNDRDALASVLETTSREAKNYFGDGTVYLEQFIEEPRHIEVQILGDKHGNVIHLFERECSIQRRYQKIIEESPSPTLTPEVRAQMGAAAVKICSDIGYQSAGTIEFLVDKNLRFYFLEMNTRIQVEHPVTEMVTGVDLVEEQIYIAGGLPLRISQDEVKQTGHAIECRIYAEDPSNNFMPSPGKMTLYHEPAFEHLRIDSAMQQATEVFSFYDPMISKLIAWGNTREESILLAIRSLEKYVIHGIKTNISYLRQLLQHPNFAANTISTRFCDAHTTELIDLAAAEKNQMNPLLPVTAFVLYNLNKTRIGGTSNLWEEIGYWRHTMAFKVNTELQQIAVEPDMTQAGSFHGLINDQSVNASLRSFTDGHLSLVSNNMVTEFYLSENEEGDTIVSHKGVLFTMRRNDQLNESVDYAQTDHGDEAGNLFAPMPGKVIKVNVNQGDQVVRGTILMVVEAMKMENNIVAPAPALVEKVNVREGDMVDTKTQLIHLIQNE